MKKFLAQLGVVGILVLSFAVIAPSTATAAATYKPDPLNVTSEQLAGIIQYYLGATYLNESSTGGALRPEVTKVLDEQKLKADVRKAQKLLKAQYGPVSVDPAVTKAARASRLTAYANAVKTLPASSQAALAAAKVKFKTPITAAKTLGKGVGGAVVAVTGYQMGTTIGSGIVSIFGVDAEGTVCGADTTGGWLAFAAGVDCSNFNVVDEYVPNGDTSTMAPGYKDNRLTFGTGPYVVGANTYPYYALGNGDPVQIVGQRVTVKVVKQYSVGNRTMGGSDLRLWCQGPTTGVVGAPMTLVAPSTWRATGGDLSSSWTATCEGIGRLPLSITVGTAAAYNANSNLQWYGPAAPEYATNSNDPNPLRHFRCDVTDTDNDKTTAVSTSFHETDESWPQVMCPTLAQGVIPKLFEVFEVNETTGAATLLQSSAVDPGTIDEKTKDVECQDGSCILDLMYAKGTKLVSCFDDDSESCAGWWADKENFTCQYGGHDVAIQQCIVYKLAFETTTSTTTTTVYCIPKPDLSGCTATETTTETETGTGTVTDPVTEEEAGCIPVGVARLNPVAWVVQPVKCALAWAFVPSEGAVQSQLDGLEENYEGSTPGKIIASIGAFDYSTPDGCEGLPVSLGKLTGGDGAYQPDVGAQKLLPACPGDFFAPWAPLVKAALIGAIVLASVILLKARIGQWFGYTT